MSQELHPRLPSDPFRAGTEGTDRNEVDIADPRGQFLKRLLPRRDGLISGANEIVQKDDGIITTEPGSEQVAPANEKSVNFPMIQVVREAELVEHGIAALTRAG